MPFLIDGHNLIGHLPDMSLSDPNDEEKLMTRLRALAERTKKRMTVVFDPDPHANSPQFGHGKSQYGLLTVIFAPNGTKADDVIRSIAGDVKDKQGLIVVTSDAAVADFTRRCGIRAQSSQEFVRWMISSNRTIDTQEVKPVGSSKEITNWAEVFKEPDPDPTPAKGKPVPKPKKGQKRSEQLKQQVKKIRPLV